MCTFIKDLAYPLTGDHALFAMPCLRQWLLSHFLQVRNFDFIGRDNQGVPCSHQPRRDNLNFPKIADVYIDCGNYLSTIHFTESSRVSRERRDELLIRATYKHQTRITSICPGQGQHGFQQRFRERSLGPIDGGSVWVAAGGSRQHRVHARRAPADVGLEERREAGGGTCG